MAKLPLSPKIVNALIEEKGEISKYLQLSKCYEKGDWQSVRRIAGEIYIEEWQIPPIYTEACEWADAITEG